MKVLLIKYIPPQLAKHLTMVFKRRFKRAVSAGTDRKRRNRHSRYANAGPSTHDNKAHSHRMSYRRSVRCTVCSGLPLVENFLDLIRTNIINSDCLLVLVSRDKEEKRHHLQPPALPRRSPS